MKRFGPVFAFAMVLIFSSVILGGIAFAAVSEQKSSSAETFSSKDIQEDDAIYFKVEKYDVSLNPPLLPYFEIYSHDGTEKDRIARTWDSEKFLTMDSVSDPSDYEFSIPKKDVELLSIDVLTDFGNVVLAEGKTFPAAEFLNQTELNTIQELEISPGNRIFYRLIEDKKRKKVFQITGFKIGGVSKSSWGNLLKSNPMEILIECNDKKAMEYAHGGKKDEHGRLRNEDLQMEDFLVDLEFTEKIDVNFQNSWGKITSFEISTEELIGKLKAEIDQRPGDFFWCVELKDEIGNSCVLKFQGVQHLYRVKSIRIPEGAPVRSEARPLLATKDPNMRVFVMENGGPCGVNSKYARSSAPRSWQNDFAPDEKNLFLVKAGCAHIYSIHVEDTSPLLDSPMVLEFVDLTADSFKSEIRQQLPSMMSKERASRIIFEEVKEKQ